MYDWFGLVESASVTYEGCYPERPFWGSQFSISIWNYPQIGFQDPPLLREMNLSLVKNIIQTEKVRQYGIFIHGTVQRIHRERH